MNLLEFRGKAKAAKQKEGTDFYVVVLMQKANGLAEGVADLQAVGGRGGASSWNKEKTRFQKEVLTSVGRVGFLWYERDLRFAGDNVQFKEVTFEPSHDAVAFVYDHDTASKEGGRMDLPPLKVLYGVGISDKLKE